MPVNHVEPLSWGSIFSVFLGLAIVIGLLLATVWLIRRLQQIQPQSQNAIQIVAQLPIGMKERLMVIRVGDENVLVGCTAGQIRTLHVWQGGLPSSPAPVQTPSGAAFMEQLRSIMADRKLP